jgi:mRNA interferase MazF
MYKRGEIVLIPVPFSDLSSVKKRPVLVISNTSHNNTNSDIIVVAITSNMQQNGIVIETKDLLSGALPKTSIIRCDKIYTLEKSIVIKQIGIVSDDVIDNVVNEINRLITEER